MAVTDIYHIAGALSPARKAVAFLGGAVDDAVQIDAAAVAAKAHATGTFSAWINVPDITGTYTIISFGDANVVEYIHFSIEAGKLFAACNDNTTMQWDINSTAVIIKPHRWMHVAIVQDGNRPTFYVDGVAVAMTDTVTTTLGAWGSILSGLDSGSIGAAEIDGAGNLTQEFKGAISTIKYWKTALTAAQIEDDYNGKADVATDATNLQNSYEFDGDYVDDGLGADDGTAVGDIILTPYYSEFTSRLRYTTGTPVVADSVQCFADKGVGHAVVIQAA